MKRVVFYGIAAEQAEKSVLEPVFRAVSQAWAGCGTGSGAEFWFAREYASRIERDFPGLAAGFYHENLPENTDLVVCLGGDGTLLDSLRLVKDSGVPVMGIHFGRLGFLNAVSADGVSQTLPPGFYDSFRRENRLVLEAGGLSSGIFPYALNEVSVLRSDNESLVHLDISVDGAFVNTYYGDGVILATPTGSTAYSLSCGGPILTPSAGSVLITPVASHMLTVRPLVLDGYKEITVEARGGERCKLMLDAYSCDLQAPFRFTVRWAAFRFTTLYPKDRSFFTSIREKLMWGLDLRSRP